MGSGIRLAEKPGKHKGTCVPAPRLLYLWRRFDQMSVQALRNFL